MSSSGLTDNSGIIPRTIYHLFSQLKSRDCDFAMRVSHIELYNEEITDLFAGEAILHSMSRTAAKSGIVPVAVT